MDHTLNILHIEDSQADFLLIERHLKQHGLNVNCTRVDSMAGLLQALVADGWDLVISDFSVPTLDFFDSFAHIQSRSPELPVILVSGSIGEEQAVEILKQGVWDFILKDNLKRLVPAIKRSIMESRERTMRKVAEAAMRESEYRFRCMFNNSPIAIGIGRMKDGRLEEVNGAWLQLLGYERDEIIGATVAELKLYVRPDERSGIVETIQKNGRVVNRAVKIRHKSGETLDVLYSAELIVLNDTVYLQAMMSDISEQRRLEEQQRELEQFSQQIIDNAEEGIVVYGPDLRYRVWNSYMERLTGLEAHNVIGRQPLELFPFLEKGGVMARLASVLDGQPVATVEFPFQSSYNGYRGWASDTLFTAQKCQGGNHRCHCHGAGYYRAAQPGGTAPSVPEDGGGRTTGGRGRSRLQ